MRYSSKRELPRSGILSESKQGRDKMSQNESHGWPCDVISICRKRNSKSIRRRKERKKNHNTAIFQHEIVTAIQNVVQTEFASSYPLMDTIDMSGICTYKREVHLHTSKVMKIPHCDISAGNVFSIDAQQHLHLPSSVSSSCIETPWAYIVIVHLETWPWLCHNQKLSWGLTDIMSHRTSNCTERKCERQASRVVALSMKILFMDGKRQCMFYS